MTLEDMSHANGTWDYSRLPANVRIGTSCYIEQQASFERFFSTRDPGLVLGDRVEVYHTTGFSVEREGCLEIGDDCVLVAAAFMCAERIVVGNRVVFSYNATVADCDFHPRDPELRRLDAIANAPDADGARRPTLSSAPVVIEDDVWLGIGALVLKGVHVGRGARIGAGAIVTRDVPAGAYIEGNPAHVATPPGSLR